MKKLGCENEVRILEALGKGLLPEAFEETLRRHVESCSSCAELISLHKTFQHDSEVLRATAQVPDAGQVWWRAKLAARMAATEQAMRPIRIVERAALAVGSGALIALLVLAAPWLAQQMPHTNIFSGTTVFTTSLSTLVVTSVIVCLVVMAGALYTLRNEK